MNNTQHKTKKASEEPEIYRNGDGNPVIFANKAQAIRKALELGGDWSVHQSPASRRFYVRKLKAGVAPESDEQCDTCGRQILFGRMEHHKTWCNSENIRAQGKPELPTLEETSVKLHEALLWQERTQAHAEALAEALRRIELRSRGADGSNITPQRFQEWTREIASDALANWEGVK